MVRLQTATIWGGGGERGEDCISVTQNGMVGRVQAYQDRCLRRQQAVREKGIHGWWSVSPSVLVGTRYIVCVGFFFLPIVLGRDKKEREGKMIKDDKITIAKAKIHLVVYLT